MFGAPFGLPFRPSAGPALQPPGDPLSNRQTPVQS